MSNVQTIPFTKLEGCGNDYLFVELTQLPEGVAADLVEHAPVLTARWCHRRFGIGADGLVVFEPTDRALARMRMWNADGSPGVLCGNALRCLAKLLGERAEHAHLERFALESECGVHAIEVTRDEGRVVWSEVELGTPSFEPESIPFDASRAEVLDRDADGPIPVRIEALGERWEGLVLSMGNPHIVLPLDRSPDELPLEQLGPALERHPAFPDRVNVGLVHLDETGELHARTWERGSGETLACGSSACAMAVGLTALGAIERGLEVNVHMPGGRLTARWSHAGAVLLSGPAREVFRGATGFAVDERPSP